MFTPWQLGPMRRTPYSRPAFASWAWSFSPSAPASANPPVTTTADFTPALPHSSMAPTTIRAGITTTAMSAGVGVAPIDG